MSTINFAEIAAAGGIAGDRGAFSITGDSLPAGGYAGRGFAARIESRSGGR